MFRWFETRIEAFPEDPPAQPPDRLLAFYVYFIKPVWAAFAVLLVAGFLGSLIEVSLLAFVGSLVDMMKTAETPEAFLANHWPILLWMAFIAMVARPIVSTSHDLIKNQLIGAPVSNRVPWPTKSCKRHRHCAIPSCS
jgi:ATP-binding cassette, subfamily B, multidrug efflux pump